MYSSIKTAIKNTLSGITGIKNVYGYEKGDLNGFPSATVVLEAVDCNYETNVQDERKYTFKIKIYQEMEDDALGAEGAETVIENLIDSVISEFEDDFTLGGLCHKVNINGIVGYTEREMNMRVLEFKIDCYALYTLS